MDLTKLGKNQISLSEWLGQIGFSKTEEFRKEDNEKRKTLAKLSQIIGLPFDKPTEFSAEDIAKRSTEFQKFFQEHYNELCAYRLIPLDQKLPKLRMRGYSVVETLKWFNEQQIDHAKYRVDIIPHSDKYIWSTIFIVNKNGIFGEIIKGNAFMLTQGFYNENSPMTFGFDFKKWRLSEENPEALNHLRQIVEKILVRDNKKQKQIAEQFSAKFFNDYLAGYFETVYSDEFGLWFIDWNKILGEIYSDYTTDTLSSDNTDNVLRGHIGYAGKVRGKVRIVNNPDTTIQPDEILVCKMTTPEYLQLMKTCAGIITEQGGILSHAAIIARELKKPCVVGVKNVMNVLKEGEMVETDGNTIIKLT